MRGRGLQVTGEAGSSTVAAVAHVVPAALLFQALPSKLGSCSRACEVTSESEVTHLRCKVGGMARI